MAAGGDGGVVVGHDVVLIGIEQTTSVGSVSVTIVAVAVSTQC